VSDFTPRHGLDGAGLVELFLWSKVTSKSEWQVVLSTESVTSAGPEILRLRSEMPSGFQGCGRLGVPSQ
jgi:hypothetical protein